MLGVLAGFNKSRDIGSLSDEVFAPVDEAHVPLAEISVVKCEGSGEHVGGLASGLTAQTLVFPENGAVVGMRYTDKQLGTLGRTFTAQVGNTIFRDDSIYMVFRMVNVGTEGYNARYPAVFCRRSAGENSQGG